MNELCLLYETRYLECKPRYDVLLREYSHIFGTEPFSTRTPYFILRGNSSPVPCSQRRKKIARPAKCRDPLVAVTHASKAVSRFFRETIDLDVYLFRRCRIASIRWLLVGVWAIHHRIYLRTVIFQRLLFLPQIIAKSASISPLPLIHLP